MGNGATYSAGRLEIFLGSNHGWGTVSHRTFNQRTADVACRQLGFDGADNFGLALNRYVSGVHHSGIHCGRVYDSVYILHAAVWTIRYRVLTETRFTDFMHLTTKFKLIYLLYVHVKSFCA